MEIEIKSATEIRITPTCDLDAAILRDGGTWSASIERREAFEMGADEIVLKATKPKAKREKP